jgi:hypothetical protein
MRRLFLFISLLFISISCSTDDNTLNEGINQSKINEVLNQNDYETQKVMYRMLNQNEKLTLWDNKINNLILNNNLNKKQVELLNELKINLKTEIFNQVSSENKTIFKTVFVKDFLNKSKSVFASEFFFDNFYNIQLKIAPIDSELPDCTCNKGSAFSCGWNSVTCRESDKCSDTDDGCGFLLLYSCNGRCFLY